MAEGIGGEVRDIRMNMPPKTPRIVSVTPAGAVAARSQRRDCSLLFPKFFQSMPRETSPLLFRKF